MFPQGDVDEVFMLDLCTLAYQLHSQALVFTFDPYLEQIKLGNKERGANRRAFFSALNTQIDNATDAKEMRAMGLRGPERLMGDSTKGWTGRPDLDPMLYDWSQISPARPGMTRQNREGEGVLVYAAPTTITSRISTFHTACYNATSDHQMVTQGQGVKDVTVSNPKTVANSGGTDTLYIFEGATGIDKNGHGIWSPMGFVLVRENASNNDYDVFIVFRGSRSGSLRFGPSLRSNGAADWVTDLDTVRQDFPKISGTGKVHHGFARSLLSMTPSITACLEHIATEKAIKYHGSKSPRNIFITGHSLGGALAHLMIGSRLVGDDSPWNGLPDQVQQWEWDKAIVPIFGAPPVGDGDLRDAFYRANGNVKNFFLNMDIVAGFRDQHKRYKMFYTKHWITRAHSPDLIRKHLENRYRFNAPNPGAQPPANARPYRDKLEPFKSYDRPSEALNAFKDYFDKPANQVYTENAARNFALFLRILASAMKQPQFSTENETNDFAELDQAAAELERIAKPNAVLTLQQLVQVFQRLQRVTLTENDHGGLGLTRMFQAWLWLVWIEQKQDYDEVKKTLEQGLPGGDAATTWICERGDTA